HHGLPWAMQRYLSSDNFQKFSSGKTASCNIAFNYLGRFEQLEAQDSPFVSRDDLIPTEADLGADEVWPYLLEVSCRYVNSQLELAIVYSPHFHTKGTVEEWLSQWEAALSTYLQVTTTVEPRESLVCHHAFTPADFPLLRCTQLELNQLLDQVLNTYQLSGDDLVDLLPTSHLQEGLLSLTLRDPSAYLIQIGFDIVGKFDLLRYKAVWKELINRYEILRTRVLATDTVSGFPLVQVVTRDIPLEWHHTRWTDEDHKAQERNFIAQDRVRGFTLKEPLIRIATFELSNGSTHCNLTVHHALLDGWSNSILLNESLALYHRCPLPPPIQYRAFIKYLRGQDEDSCRAYWQAELADVKPTPTVLLPPPAVEPPADALPEIYSGTFAQSSDNLQQFSRNHGITLASLIRALWSLLLSQYLGEREEVVFGVVVSGRSTAVDGIERMVGMCINTVPCRVQFQDDQPVLPWLRHLHSLAGAMIPYEHCRLVDIQQWCEIPKETNLFQSIIVFENYPNAAQELSQPEITYQQGVGHEFTEYPLSGCFIEDEGRLHVKLHYSKRLYERGYIEAMFRYLDHCLGLILDAEDHTLMSNLFTLPEPERQLVLHTWPVGPTDASPENDVGLHQLFVQHALRQPQHCALESGTNQWTYDEFYTLASRTGTWLLEQGMRPNVPVAVVIDRCPEMLFGIFGTLLGGGSYVTIEATNAVDRIRFMLEELDQPLVLSTTKWYSLLTEELGIPSSRLGYIDEIVKSAAHDELTTERLNVDVQPTDLAYIIFTSGTTGTPKGVQICHRGIVNFIRHGPHNFNLTPDSRVMQFFNVAFDGCVSEIFNTLCSGATLVLRGDDFTETAKKVNTILLTPSALTILDPANYPNLQLVSTAGEALPYALAQRWASHCALYNSYGPSEASIGTHVARVLANQTISVGLPITNSQCYILDEQLRPVPPGVVGEVCVAGHGLSLGYWKRPDLTRLAFVTNPWGPGLLYRTGDLARWLPNGETQYISRKDSQIKLRGFRIELEEVESIAERYPTVQLSTAIVKDSRLVLYAMAPKDTDPGKLSAFMALKLPRYMVPSLIIICDDLPLTKNGKIDRKKIQGWELPQSGNDSARGDEGLAGPHSRDPSVLQRICTALAATLSLDATTLNVNASFFELGGDSISAIQFAAKCKRAGLDVTVAQVFKTPVLVHLASVVDQVDHDGDQASTALELMDPCGEVPLTPIQTWFLEQPFRNPHQFNMSFLLKSRVPVNLSQLTSSFTQLVAHHDMLRVRLAPSSSGQWQQHVPQFSAESCFDFVRMEEVTLTRAELSPWVAGIQPQLSMTEGPLVAVGLIHMVDDPVGENQHMDSDDMVFVTLHHIAMDLVSWRIIMEDLQTLLTGGNLPSKTIPFRQWAHLLQEHASTVDPTVWPSYGTTHRLPLDFPENTTHPVPSYECRSLEAELGVNLTNKLLSQLTTVAGVTPQECMVAALALAVNKLWGLPSLEMELESHGRCPWNNSIDISRTIGWFTVTYPLPIHLPTHSELNLRLTTLRHIKQRLRSIPDSGFPYSLLRYLRSPNNQPSDQWDHTLTRAYRKPDLLFNYLGRFEQLEGDAPFWESRDDWLGADTFNVGEDEEWNRVLDAVCRVEANRGLVLCLTYNRQFHRQDTVEQLLNYWHQELQAIVMEALESPVPCYAPTDYPLLRCTESELDTLLLGDFSQAGYDVRQVENMYTCAPLQEGLLFAMLKDPSAYVVQSAFTIRGPLDKLRFKQAWEYVGQAHKILRTRFLLGGGPKSNLNLQVVFKQFNAEWTEIDLDGVDPDAAEKAYVRDDRRRGFTISQPLVRFALFSISPTHHRFIFTVHHALMDGWSSPLLVNQVLLAYSGKPQPARIGYDCYIETILAQDPVEARTYWVGTVGVNPTPCLLAGPKPWPSVTHTTRDNSLSCFVHHQLLDVSSLQQFSQSQGITFATLLRAAWALLLHQYTGVTDVFYGVIVSGRNLPMDNVEHLVGLCVNNIPFRVPIDRDQLVSEWLAMVYKRATSTVQYEHCRLSDIQRWVGLGAESALFNTVLVYENYPIATPQESLPISMEADYGVEHTEYDLSLCAFTQGADLHLKMEYQPTQFDPRFVEQLVHHMGDLLLALSETTVTTRVTDLVGGTVGPTASIVCPPDRVPLVDHSSTIPSAAILFRAQAHRTPHAVALQDEGDRKLTYSQLDQLSDIVASNIHQQGVVPGTDTVVGILTAWRWELIIAQLAIWKAGAAFVVLDPEYPPERIRLILQDTESPLVLVNSATSNALPSDIASTLDTMSLEELCDQLATMPDLHNAPLLEKETQPDDLAWVVYTSGSTGTPKGVMVEHRGAVNCFVSANDVLCCDATTVAFPLLKTTFDASIAEIWVPLTHGGTLLTAPMDMLTALSQVNTICSTPSLLATLDPREFSNLRTVIVGGESISQQLATTWSQLVRLVNCYGPSETSVNAYIKRLCPDQPVTIGSPIAHVSGYVLNDRREPVPPGVVGELYIAGAGVARGYLHRPELTEEKFISNPFGPGRLYCTGDSVRQLPNGELEFVGRLDDQVKIHGFRVELGEIENILAKHSGIQGVCVLVQDQRLVAYTVPQSVTSAEMLEFARMHLPFHMIPSVVVPLDRFPTTTVGKVDKAALPRVTTFNEHQAMDSATGELSGDIQRMLGLVADVLELSPTEVHPTSTFFQLGGDSLTAIRLAARCRQAGWELPLADINRHHTLLDLIGKLEPLHTPAQAEQGLVKGEVLPTPIQLNFLTMGQPNPHKFRLTMVLETTTVYPLTQWQQAIQQVVLHHDLLRCTYHSQVDGSAMGLIAQSELPLEDYIHHGSVNDETELTVKITPLLDNLDFTQGPIFQIGLFDRTDKASQYFCFTAHHLVVDLASLRVIVEDLETLLNGFSLPPKTLSFQQWSLHLRKFAEELDATDWPVTPFPQPITLDFPDNLTLRTLASQTVVSAHLSSRDTKRLLGRATEELGATPLELLLTALVQAFTTCYDRPGLALDFQSHGRQAHKPGYDVSRTVGWFTTLYPVVLTLDSESTDPLTALRQVQHTLDHIPHRGFTYPLLKHFPHDQNPEAHDYFTTTPQYAFNYLGQFDASGVKSTSALFTSRSDIATEFSQLGLENKWPYLLDFICFHDKDQLALNLGHSSMIFKQGNMTTLVNTWKAKLEELVAYAVRD
ncbi:hypothetical protein IWQ62_002300, partial [Dispira parvispora]